MRHLRPPHTLSAGLLAGVLAAVGCGDGEQSSNGSAPPGSVTPVLIRGTERVGWDQAAASLQEVAGYVFTLHVDDAPQALTGVRCNPGNKAFECSAPLPPMSPGLHQLRLSASANGLESARSARLLVMVTSGSLAAAAPPIEPATRSSACLEAANECYDVSVLAEDLGQVSWLTAAANEVFFVEDGTRVRAARNGRLQEAPLHEAPAAGAKIVGLTLAPDFTESRKMFVATVDEEAGGERFVAVSRFRDLGVLGERAVVLRLPLPPDSPSVPIAMSADGFLYLALPAFTSHPPPMGAPLNGSLLRFTPDGAVPADSAMASPVVVEGYEEPSDILISGPRLWLAGRDHRWAHVVSSLPLAPAASSARPGANPELLAPPGMPAPDRVELASVGESGSPGLVAYGGAVFRLNDNGGRLAGLERLRLDGMVRAVAGARDGGIYVAMVKGATRSSLLRLRPRGGHTSAGTIERPGQ